MANAAIYTGIAKTLARGCVAASRYLVNQAAFCGVIWG